jgi:hypothetical protein
MDSTTENEKIEQSEAPAKSAKRRVGLPKFRKKTKRIVVTTVVAIIALICVYFVINWFTAPLHVTKIETTKALSSRVEDAPVQTDFKVGEPIMLHFEYKDAVEGKPVKFEIKDASGDVIKTGFTSILRIKDGDSADGQRYVSIVNTPETTLVANNYRATLSIDGRVVAKHSFKITE